MGHNLLTKKAWRFRGEEPQPTEYCMCCKTYLGSCKEEEHLVGLMDTWEISEGEGLVELLPKRRYKLVLKETTSSESKI